MLASDANAGRMMATLQRLLEIPAACLQTALTHAANAIADALQADKVDAFLYDESRDSLVALGTSTQPLSILQKKLGLGPGIPDEMLPRSFERFVTGRTREGGMGLGLYIAWQVVRAYGGELAAEPPPGRGARLLVRIPLYREWREAK